MTDHFLHRHYDPPVYGDRPEPWQLTYTCGGCGEELWTDEEGHGSTVGTPDDALQQHIDEIEQLLHDTGAETLPRTHRTELAR